MLGGFESEQTTLVTSSADPGEHTRRLELGGDGVEDVLVGVTLGIVDEIEQFPDLAGGEDDAEKVGLVRSGCHGGDSEGGGGSGDPDPMVMPATGGRHRRWACAVHM